MPMLLTDRIFAPSRGSADEVIAFARRNGAERIEFLSAWARRVYELAALSGMDASLPIAQSHLETGGWKDNEHWGNGNPAGIGITGSASSDEIVIFRTGVQAAECQMVHLALYATGGTPDTLLPFKDADFRYDDYLAAFGPMARARTIHEFGGGNWAVDPLYSEKWIGRGNLIWPSLPDQSSPSHPPTGRRKISVRRDLCPSRSGVTVSQPWNARNDAYDYGHAYCMDDGRHVGTDYGNLPRGTPTVSLTEGTVVHRTPDGVVERYFRPMFLDVKRDNGDIIRYAHLWTIEPTITVGSRVEFGTPTGTIGEQTKVGTRTPDGSGSHSHVECLEPNGSCESGQESVDPETYNWGWTGTDEDTAPVPSANYWTAIPGLPGGKLGTKRPVRVNLIPINGPQRTGAKARLPRVSVQHGTGNASNPSAWNEMAYFVAGAEGRGVSVHACGDPKETVIGLPLDEMGVHAGNADGNGRGYACEMIEATSVWNDPEQRDATIENCAEVMGRAAARLNVAEPQRHSNFGNPNCPAKLQTVRIGSRLAWDVYAEQWRAAKADEIKRMKGDPPPPPPPPPEPGTIPAAMKRELVRAETVGLTLARLHEQFGTRVDGYTFDVKGRISLQWLRDGLRSGEFPALTNVAGDDDDRWFWFEGGRGYRWDGTTVKRVRLVADEPETSMASSVVQIERVRADRSLIDKKVLRWEIVA